VTIRLLTGDCRDVLATLPEASVHCVVTSPPYYALRSYLHAEHPDKRRELGSEATPAEYLAAMVEVFRAVRRVLRDDGTCWVNIGDSYSDGGSGANKRQRNQPNENRDGTADTKAQRGVLPAVSDGAKPKDLLLMPARLALALQADGWWVRSDIIWHKPNPMPESCTDRPTSAHEHVFLLSKRARYFYDADAVREANTEATADRYAAGYNASWKRAQLASVADERTEGFAGTPDAARGRNLRNVWTIATHAYSDAHFATFPPQLVERCIRAGTSERGCCAACGAPWVRQTTTSFEPTQNPAFPKAGQKGVDASNGWGEVPRGRVSATTTGWSPGCLCNAGTQPCTVLDPFVGSGTTALVADRLQRHAIGLDLSIDYAAMAQRRLEADAPLFTSVPVHPVETEIADLFSAAAD